MINVKNKNFIFINLHILNLYPKIASFLKYLIIKIHYNMAKSTKSTTAAPKVNKAQDQKEVKSFLGWTVGITLAILVLLYFLFSNNIG